MRHSQASGDQADSLVVTLLKQTFDACMYPLRMFFIALAISMLCSGSNNAQILQGDWVDQSQAAIEEHRKTDVTVIVLDQNDRAVQGATVRLVQQRHDFEVGLTLPVDRMPPKKAGDLPVYRSINAIALDRYTNWAEASEAAPRDQAKRLKAWAEAIDPIHSHFGRVISADPAKNHDRMSLLEPAELRDAVNARIDLATIYEPRPDRYDLYADLLSQDMIERKLGQGMLPRMFERAASRRPDARFGVRVRNAIALQSGRAFAAAIQKMEVRQVRFDHITIEQSFPGPIQPKSLQRMFEEYISPLPVSVSLANLEISGPTPVAAAIKIETLLRLAFAEPNVTGISFAGLQEQDLVEPNAALLDKSGKPTASGEALDALFTKLWHSDESGVTDERGNAEARVFTGWYTLTAKLPDGTVIESQAYIPKDERSKLIVLQVTAAEAK